MSSYGKLDEKYWSLGGGAVWGSCRPPTNSHDQQTQNSIRTQKETKTHNAKLPKVEEPTLDEETKEISEHVEVNKNNTGSTDVTTEKVKSKKGSIYREVLASPVRETLEKSDEAHKSV